MAQELVINQATYSDSGLPCFEHQSHDADDFLPLPNSYGQEEEKQQLIDYLIANVCCWDEKDRRILNDLGIDTLRSLTEDDDDQPQEPQGPSFIGASVPMSANAIYEDDDCLPLPTLNFEESTVNRTPASTSIRTDYLPLPHMNF